MEGGGKRLRYTREELEGFRDANTEAPQDFDASCMYTEPWPDDAKSIKKRRDRVERRNARKKAKHAERALIARNYGKGRVSASHDVDDDDEDGDFGGMFSNENIFQGVFVDDQGNGSHDHCHEISEDDDDDDDGPMQKPAFIVEGEPNFESGEPEDGWEYVRRVRWEAARCPGIKVAKIAPEKLVGEQTQYIPVLPPIPVCDPHLLPSKDWEGEFLLNFSELRTKLENSEAPDAPSRPLPHRRDESGWKTFCFGSSRSAAAKNDENPATGEDVDLNDVAAADIDAFGATETGSLMLPKGQVPFQNIVLNLDEVTRASLLQNQISWLKGLSNLPRYRAVWLFSLMAAVANPIDAETSFALRTLLRNCSTIRASKTFKDEGELQMLNMMITVAGKYFGQDDTNC